MIIEFSVKNFRSFKEEQTLSFVASNYDKSLPENVIAIELPGLPDLKLVKAVALYGPNAGGKSNVLLALQFLRFLVVDSATRLRPEKELPLESFLMDLKSRHEPICLTLSFIAERVRYELAVAVKPERIVQERLVAYTSGRAEVWYDRIWNEETNGYDWSPTESEAFILDSGIVGKTRPNSLFLSTAAQWNNQQVGPIFRWFQSRIGLLDLSAGASITPNITAVMLSESPEIHKAIQGLMHMADLGLSRVEAKKRASPRESLAETVLALEKAIGEQSLPQDRWDISFYHEAIEGETISMPWTNESAGTCRFFSLLGPVLSTIRNGLLISIDELDTSLHPMLAAELLRLFFKSPPHETGAQLIFTTHNPLLLDTTLLRRDQIWFADKNREGASFLYPLTDYKPRNDESLVRGYLAGRYGAIPFIPKGLIAENDTQEQPPAPTREVVDAS